MSKSIHALYVGLMVLIVIGAMSYLAYVGYGYYGTPLEERFYHPQHEWFKPSGAFGHGLGIAGTLMILFGVTIYILRKRYNLLTRLIRLKYLLEFHIFLCTLGPILILFHTAFKFGGIVSIAFWSMVAVVISGVIGRFVYIQIPRTIEGRELTLNEVKNMKQSLSDTLQKSIGMDDELRGMILSFTGSHDSDASKQSKASAHKPMKMSTIKRILKKKKIVRPQRNMVIRLIREEVSLAGKIRRLQRMQQLFKYWHVAHLPFAIIMLVIAIVHVAVTLSFGYKWIF